MFARVLDRVVPERAPVARNTARASFKARAMTRARVGASETTVASSRATSPSTTTMRRARGSRAFARVDRRASATTRASSVDASSSSVESSSTSGGNTTLVLAGVVAVGAVTATHAAGDATVRVVGSAILGLLLALVGYKKKSLDASGALAAIGVGFGSIYADARFGAALASFFFTSSAVTRVRADVKKKVEEDYKVGGGRNAMQVFANGFVPTMIALAFVFGGGAFGSSSALASAYLAYYACCGGDTWASELGVLSKSKPRLITNWTREVTPGTNGGVTALGWAASASGGAAVGAAFHVGQTALRAFASDSLVAHAPSNALLVIGFSALAGVFGSLVDSVLGATIQFSGYCKERKRVVSKPGPTVTRISGLEVLSNSMVNLVSGIITAVIAYALAPL